jgi:tetratricopeptide (TPR) repeat protein
MAISASSDPSIRSNRNWSSASIRDVTYRFGELDELALAYAITIHKSQGSEFPAVVIPLAMQQYLLLQRNLIYTGITRGRKLVVLIGQTPGPRHRRPQPLSPHRIAVAVSLTHPSSPVRWAHDLDAQVLLAEALMNTMPWDYWLGDRSPKPETEEAIASLRYVMLRNPDHPGANHLFIHAVEAGPNPELGLPAADRLLHFAPQAGHLVHMPSHIYMRVGQYHEATLANELAVAADRSYIQSCRAQGFYPGVYYPHNVHFLWWATLFEGRSADAMRAARQVADIAIDAVCGPTPVLEAPRFRHLPWLTSLRFGRWDEILAVNEPPATNSFMVDRVMWHYTRGLALAALTQADAAAEEHARMVALLRLPEVASLDTPYFPATGILKVAEHVLAARIAQARGDSPTMIAQFDEAVAAEDALPYMEPAFWSLPTRQSYGAALLQAGEPARAEEVFRKDLELFPRNGWSLFGLEQALRAQGRTQAAEGVHREWNQAWKHADVLPDLAWF